MLLQVAGLGVHLLQEAGTVGWDPRSLWNQMGLLAKCRGHRPVHHVRLVDRRHDRPFDGIQRRARNSRARSLRRSPAHCAKASWMKR